jgi:hypothetical protein
LFIASRILRSCNQDEETKDDGSAKPLSRKERKLKSRMTIALLKQLCPRPEVIEVDENKFIKIFSISSLFISFFIFA